LTGAVRLGGWAFEQLSPDVALTRLVLLNGDDVTAVPAQNLLWDRLGRSLLPTYGARANAADSLLDLQQTRRARAEAVHALTLSAPCLPSGHEVSARSTR
jgi:hypothetical protein